jgi:sucrose-6-phosphate hydrolase SacC (GH32 family)
MNNWLYAANIPTSTWRGANTLPRELTLRRTAEGLRLVQTPLAAFEALRTPLGTWADVTLDGTVELEGVRGRTLEIIVEFKAETAERFGIEIHSGGAEPTRLLYNTAQSRLVFSRSDRMETGYINGFTRFFTAPLELEDKRLRLHVYVDESSVEAFTADGTLVMSSQTFVDPAHDGLKLFAENGTATVKHLEVYALKDVWSSKPQEMSKEIDYCG